MTWPEAARYSGLLCGQLVRCRFAEPFRGRKR
jgi:hypothetical protein